jgi:aldehyde:ferredoxin oxidoreductase
MNNTTQLQNLPQDVTECLQTILNAIASGDYDLFTTVGTSSYKAGITRQMFEGVSEQLAPRMAQGYSTTYFGALKQLHYQVYLWKLSFADDGDEFVTRMTMDGDKVAGILIT